MASSKESVIIFGSTGAIGTALAEILSKEHPGWEILAVTRSIQKESRLSNLKLPNVKMVEGDPFQKDQVLSLSENCSIIFCCVGFHLYETKYWGEHWPLVVDNLLEATTANSKKRKLVFCDNLYAYNVGDGSNNNKIISPKSSTVEPSLKTKPAIRALLRQKFENHMKEHPGLVAVVGGSDFFGPHVTETSFLGDTMTGKIVKNETPLALFSSQKVHDFCFTTDFARAMAIASVNDKAYDKFWICPHSIHGKTMYDMAQDIARLAGKATPVKVMVMPGFIITMLSPFVTMMAEFSQMKSIWNQDYIIHDSEFCETFGVTSTPADEALQALVDFYKAD